MSQGNGAFSETNSASGTSFPQYCCSPIRSLPSAPRPCKRITRRRGFPPATGGRDGPDRAISIGELAFLGTGIGGGGIADPPGRCHAAMIDGCEQQPTFYFDAQFYGSRRHAVRAEPDRLSASGACPFGA